MKGSLLRWLRFVLVRVPGVGLRRARRGWETATITEPMGAASGLGNEPKHAEWGERQGCRSWPAVTRLGNGLHRAEIPDPAAAVDGGVGVDHLAPSPRERQADPVVGVRHGGEVGDAGDRVPGFAGPAAQPARPARPARPGTWPAAQPARPGT